MSRLILFRLIAVKCETRAASIHRVRGFADARPNWTSKNRIDHTYPRRAIIYIFITMTFADEGTLAQRSCRRRTEQPCSLEV